MCFQLLNEKDRKRILNPLKKFLSGLKIQKVRLHLILMKFMRFCFKPKMDFESVWQHNLGKTNLNESYEITHKLLLPFPFLQAVEGMFRKSFPKCSLNKTHQNTFPFSVTLLYDILTPNKPFQDYARDHQLHFNKLNFVDYPA